MGWINVPVIALCSIPGNFVKVLAGKPYPAWWCVLFRSFFTGLVDRDFGVACRLSCFLLSSTSVTPLSVVPTDWGFGISVVETAASLPLSLSRPLLVSSCWKAACFSSSVIILTIPQSATINRTMSTVRSIVLSTVSFLCSVHNSLGCHWINKSLDVGMFFCERRDREKERATNLDGNWATTHERDSRALPRECVTHAPALDLRAPFYRADFRRNSSPQLLGN